MAKGKCFLCDKELGRISLKMGVEALTKAKITIPAGFNEESILCWDCYEKEKKITESEAALEQGDMRTARLKQLEILVPEYKKTWDKNGIIQFKNERVAILKRQFGRQVEFIIAFDQLTAEGYRLMAIDEGKEGQAGAVTGGISSYYYFQKMEYVR